MGNSQWRLETTLNLTLLNAKDAGVLDQIEIIVSDWGSVIPLKDVLSLVPEAEKKVKFLHIPKKISDKEQKDSKFAEVLALNAAARRTEGHYIGRIDNDTVIGKEFFVHFFSIIEGGGHEYFDIQNSYLFVERRSVPYRFTSRSFSMRYVQLFLFLFGSKLKIETAEEFGTPFWNSPVGIMIFHRKIWDSCKGYDQKLLYWGWMESDLALRLKKKHDLIDFKVFVGNHFFHLEHYSSLTAYKDRNGPATPRKKNPKKMKGLSYTVNDENWGLFNYSFKLQRYTIKEVKNYNLLYGRNVGWLNLSIKFSSVLALILLDQVKGIGIEELRNNLGKLKVKLGMIRTIIRNNQP
jgi:hypothetical protein